MVQCLGSKLGSGSEFRVGLSEGPGLGLGLSLGVGRGAGAAPRPGAGPGPVTGAEGRRKEDVHSSNHSQNPFDARGRASGQGAGG